MNEDNYLSEQLNSNISDSFAGDVMLLSSFCALTRTPPEIKTSVTES